jgi:hypothetical protein
VGTVENAAAAAEAAGATAVGAASAAAPAWQLVPALSDAAFAEKQQLLRQRLKELEVEQLPLK